MRDHYSGQLQRGDNLITGWVTSEGTIRSITVDGSNDFASGDSFAYDIPIIIVVNTFAGSGCEDITVIAE